MRRIRSHLTYANVISTLCLVLVLGGGVAYAANTVFSTDIVDGEVKNPDLGTNSVRTGKILDGQVQTGDVANGNLNDEDVAQGTFVNFTGSIGNVPAQDCVEREVSGVNAQGDHLVLTPNFNTQEPRLIYSAEYSGFTERMDIQVCNPTGSAINDQNTQFNLLVIDAQ